MMHRIQTSEGFCYSVTTGRWRFFSQLLSNVQLSYSRTMAKTETCKLASRKRWKGFYTSSKSAFEWTETGMFFSHNKTFSTCRLTQSPIKIDAFKPRNFKRNVKSLPSSFSTDKPNHFFSTKSPKNLRLFHNQPRSLFQNPQQSGLNPAG